MLANSPAGVVKDIIFDDGGSSIKIHDAIGDFVQLNELGNTSLFHLLTNQRKVSFEIELIGTHEHRIASCSLMSLGIDILSCESLLETVGVHPTDLLAMMHEGEAVGIVDADNHVLAVIRLQIAEGGVITEGRNVLHVA